MPLTTEQATAALDAAIAKAGEMGIAVSVAVVDQSGYPIAVKRMDGAPAPTSEIAIGKAKVSVLFGLPSGEFPGPIADALNGMQGWRLVFFEGAVPIRVGAELVGAIGGSGSTSENDAAAAQAGADALDG